MIEKVNVVLDEWVKIQFSRAGNSIGESHWAEQTNFLAVEKGSWEKKIIEIRYIGIFLIIGKIIDIDIRHPKFIGDLKELSTKLSISKMMGDLSKNYRYRKK